MFRNCFFETTFPAGGSCGRDRKYDMIKEEQEKAQMKAEAGRTGSKERRENGSGMHTGRGTGGGMDTEEKKYGEDFCGYAGSC